MLKKIQLYLLNFSVLIILSQITLLAAVSDLAHTKKSVSYDKLLTTDQPFVFFKSIKGAKYPWMIKCDPRINQLDFLLFGSNNTDKKRNGLVKSSKDLASLVVLRSTIKYADGGMQIDKRYEGYRETYLGVAFENLLKLVDLIPSEKYNGMPLIDEYKNNLPQKWVLDSSNDLAAIQDYFVKNQVDPLEEKPLLLLEFIKTNTTLESSNFDFLQKYFNLVDEKHPTAKAFFDNCQEYVSSTLDRTKDAKNVLETTGETFLRMIEPSTKDFDVKKLLTMLTFFGAGAITKDVLTTINSSISRDNKKLMLLAIGGSAAVYVCYKAYSKSA